MFMAKEENNLTLKEKMQIATRSGLGSLPYAGSLFNWYFSYNDAIEDKRLREFVEKLSFIIEDLKFEIEQVSDESKEVISLVIERVSKDVIDEIREEKRSAYLNYLRSLFSQAKSDQPLTNEVELFLSILEHITLLEIQVLKKVKNEEEGIDIDEISIDNVEAHLIMGATSMLKDKGLLVGGQNITFGFSPETGHFSGGRVKVGKFGQKFIEYCLR